MGICEIVYKKRNVLSIYVFVYKCKNYQEIRFVFKIQQLITQTTFNRINDLARKC